MLTNRQSGPARFICGQFYRKAQDIYNWYEFENYYIESKPYHPGANEFIRVNTTPLDMDFRDLPYATEYQTHENTSGLYDTLALNQHDPILGKLMKTVSLKFILEPGHHWFKQWFGAYSVPSHYLHQW